MDSPADRDPPRDVNPYRSPEWAAGDSAPEDLLRAYGQYPIRLRGAITLRHATKAGVDGIGGVAVGRGFWISWPAMVLLVTARALALSPQEYRRGVVFLLLLACVLSAFFLGQLLSSLRLRRLYREQRGIFQFQHRTVNGDHIEATTREGVTRTSWDDYESCILQRDLVALRLRLPAIERRRQQSGEPLSWFDRLDIFPREHFENELAWEAFVALAKRMSSKR